MTATLFNIHTLEGLTLSQPAHVSRKLQRFAQAGPEHIYYLFDFDRTLTTSKHTGDNTTTWQILHSLLPVEGQEISQAIRKKYLTLEDAGQMSLEDSHTFSASLLDLHANNGTNLQDIKRAAKQIKLRDGSQGLFTACDAAHIPTVILSAGIRDIIELITRENDIHPTLTVSIKLQFDGNGHVIGWDKNSLILTHNKAESVKQWVSHISSVRPLTVLIGDTIEDARMVEGDETVLRVRVCDLKTTDPAMREAYAQESFTAGYDIVVEEDLSPLIALTEWFGKKR